MTEASNFFNFIGGLIMSDPKATGIDPNTNKNVRVGNVPEDEAEKLRQSDQDAIDTKNPEKKNNTPPVPPKR